jgi:phospholipid/cholesterol/gamma-HCH transport system ATP-binding protein
VIEVNNINKSFGEKQVLRDFSFVFERGKANLIIGESGTGKSVLIKCMVGSIIPESGEVLYDGVDFLKADYNAQKEVRRNIAMLFQGGALFDSMSVEDNIKFALLMFTEMNEKDKTDRAQFCLERVNLPHAAKLYPAELSGGMNKVLQLRAQLP